MRYGKIAAAALLGGLLFVSGVCTLRAQTQQHVSADAWLVSDVWEMPAPAFKAGKNIRGEAFDTPKILDPNLPMLASRSAATKRKSTG